jgi:hypothetical protein
MAESDSFILVQPAETDVTENVDQLASRLLASRYGELRCLRQLAAVSKNAPTLEAAFQEQIQPARGAAGPSSEAGPARRSDQAEAADEELRALSSSRRVSGIGAFRSRLEAVFAGAQQLGAPRRAATVPTPRPAPLTRRPSFTAPSPAPAPAEPERPAQINELRRELARLEEAEAASRRLADPHTRARLERVVGSRSNDRDPATATERVRALRSLLASRRGAERAARPAARRPPSEPLGWRALAAAAAPPPAAPEPPEEGVVEAAATGDNLRRFQGALDTGELRNLELLQGASFELLLSIQRNIQQELAAALHAAAAPPAPPVSAAVAPAQRGSQGLGACVVCTEAEVSTLLYSCGHLCACARCAFTLKARKAPCPICRTRLNSICTRARWRLAPRFGSRSRSSGSSERLSD